MTPQDHIEDLEFRLAMAGAENRSLIDERNQLRKQLTIAEEHLSLEARISYHLACERGMG